MKWIHYALSLGCLFFLIVMPSKAKMGQISQEMETFLYDVSGLRDLEIPDFRIVQPDPIPEPKPMPNPGGNPKPEPL